MKPTTTLILLALSTASITHAHTQTPDSLQSKELEEVVVEGSAQHVSSTQTTYYPTSKTKQASQDAVDLLRRMAMPQLSVSPTGSTVTTAAGQSVTIFINYVQAEARDIQGLKTTDVKRVEYLDYPSDPRFRGVPHAVNIIVQEYEWGGYTKVSDREWFLQGISNQGSLYSKFAYKKMVYDIYGSWEYVNSDYIGGSSSSTYRLPTGEVTRSQKRIDSDFRNLYIPISFRASYNTDKIQINNTIGYTFQDQYKLNGTSALTFSDMPERNFVAMTDNPLVNRTLAWYGNYFFSLPRQWSLAFYPSFNYGNNNSWSHYSTDIPEQLPIDNNAVEDTYYGRLNLNVSKRIGNHHTIQLNANGALSRYNVDYSGSTEYASRFSHHFWGLFLAYTLNIDHISLNTDIGLVREYQKTNSKKYNDSYPCFHLNGNWAPNNRNQLALWMQFASNSPGQSMRTPNVLQQNELMYAQGNPLLENARHVTVGLNYTFLPSNMFNMSAYTQYYGLYDRALTVYKLYNDGNALLKTYENNGNFTQMTVGVNATLKLLSNSLIIQLSPRYVHFASTGIINKKHNPFTCSLYAQYYLGQFNFSGYYSLRSYYMAADNGAYSTNRGTYLISAGWSNKDWNIQVQAANFLRGRCSVAWSDYDFPLYSTRNISYNGNASAALGVSVTYTIGYGKPIQRGNELQGVGSSGSAIM